MSYKDVGAPKLELQKKLGLFRDEFPGLLMKVPTDSLGLVRFRRKVVKKDK